MSKTNNTKSTHAASSGHDLIHLFANADRRFLRTRSGASVSSAPCGPSTTVLFSYSTPIAYCHKSSAKNGGLIEYYINGASYSVTTSKHQHKFINAIPSLLHHHVGRTDAKDDDFLSSDESLADTFARWEAALTAAVDGGEEYPHRVCYHDSAGLMGAASGNPFEKENSPRYAAAAFAAIVADVAAFSRMRDEMKMRFAGYHLSFDIWKLRRFLKRYCDKRTAGRLNRQLDELIPTIDKAREKMRDRLKRQAAEREALHVKRVDWIRKNVERVEWMFEERKRIAAAAVERWRNGDDSTPNYRDPVDAVFTDKVREELKMGNLGLYRLREALEEVFGENELKEKERLAHGHTALRVNGTEVESNRGARLPLGIAKRVFDRIKNQLDAGTDCKFENMTAGPYELREISDGHLQIGCHYIPLSEVRLLAVSCGW